MFLLYCMTQDEPLPTCAKLEGVGGEKVCDGAKNGVRYFYSEWSSGKDAPAIKDDVLKFHQVLQALFAGATVIPFRFPTHVADEAELAALMESTSSEYATELARLHGAVQMRIKITGTGENAAEKPASSGTEYLRQRAASPVNETLRMLADAIAPLAMETKKSHRTDAAVLYILLQRTRLEELKTLFTGMTGLPATVSVSGPWPPTEFVNCYPELSPADPAAAQP